MADKQDVSALLAFDRPETIDRLARARVSLELYASALDVERRRLVDDLDRLRTGARSLDERDGARLRDRLLRLARR